ncbi:MAG: trigger factor [Parachlamydiaceae bacterium]|nr:trigger factor [Parachlamydiaceae bacterium]
MTNTTEFKNENITVSVSKEPGARVTFNVSVSPEATKAAHAKAIKAVNQEVSVPGFRKGKAPEKFVMENYGKQVEAEWRELVLQTGLQEAMQLVKETRPYKRDGISCTGIKEISKEKGAQFTLEFEEAPQVPQINLSDISLKSIERQPVTQDQVNNILTDLQFRLAKWEDAQEKATEEDFVDLDIEKLDEPQENICKDARFAVKDMAAWMRKLIIGMKAGESVEATSERDPNQDPAAPFTPTNCHITVKAVKKALLPELSDEFAKKVGLGSLVELEERITADLNRKADQEMREGLHHQLDQMLLEKYHFELPLTLLKDEILHRKEDAIAWLVQSGASQDVVTKREQELEKTLPAQVENSCRLFFLFMAFSNQHKIAVTREEIAQELSKQILEGQRAPADRNSKEVQDRLSQLIMLRKSRDYIVDHVKRA